VTEKQCIAASKAEHVLVIVADVTKLEDLKRIVEVTVKTFHKIDVLVNNAGASNTQSLLTTTPEGYDDMMNLNARAPFFLMQYCTPHLAETKGNVVNISSIAAIRGQPTYTAYAMAKAASDQLTRSACVELGGKGIRVNTINPGLIESDFASALGATKEQFKAVADGYTKIVPVRRHGQPIDIAECILFLASSKAAFVDGVNLVADGGKTAGI